MGGSGGGFNLKKRAPANVSSPDFLKSGSVRSVNKNEYDSSNNEKAQEKEEKISQQNAAVENASKPVREDSDYLNELPNKTNDNYKIYLKLRDDYANSPIFYFDMADWFYKLGDRETALRVLTSIAELELEDASLYRMLGYKFKEYGEYRLQKFVCQKVVEWRPMDPQSHRDYALALADNGEAQAALDSLYAALTRLYPSANIGGRSSGIEEVIVTEINRLIAKNPKLNSSKIDKRLIMDNPVDVRVVLNWNMNNTDLDLLVKDPNNEYCHSHWRRRQTSIGGYMSSDNTSGYGPEQFMLKRAVRGKYQIYVNYAAAREFAKSEPAAVMAEIYTKYDGKTEHRQVVCLQISKEQGRDGEKVLIAEFELGSAYLRSDPNAAYDTTTPAGYKNRSGGRFGSFSNTGGGLDDLRRRGELNTAPSAISRSGTLTGNRSRASIQRVVMQNMAAMRYAYNRRLREKPNLAGKITVKFAVNEFGMVIFAQVTESTMNDAKFENTIVERVKNWAFERIDSPGDITEVSYPFVFSQ
jgi:TonB family protein